MAPYVPKLGDGVKITATGKTGRVIQVKDDGSMIVQFTDSTTVAVAKGGATYSYVGAGKSGAFEVLQNGIIYGIANQLVQKKLNFDLSVLLYLLRLRHLRFGWVKF